MCLVSTIFQVDRVDVITEDECLRDYSFIMTESVNNYLAEHVDLTNRYIIYCSFLMDFMLVFFIVMWYMYWKSFRLVITYIFFFGIRAVIQVSTFWNIPFVEQLFHDAA